MSNSGANVPSLLVRAFKAAVKRLNALLFKASNQYRDTEFKAYSNMDPRLQVAVVGSALGCKRNGTSSCHADEIAVLARVRSVVEWMALTDVRHGVTIGTIDSGHTLVTARIPVKSVEAVRKNPNVVSLKAAQRMHPVLTETVRELGIRPQTVPSVPRAQGGDGVVIGIVDNGCDFAHKNFVANAQSRIEFLWDQGSAPATQGSPAYGRVYARTELTNALGQAEPYKALGYKPQVASHGTHVLDIACGNGQGSGVAGVAPNATVIFVECSHNADAATGIDADGLDKTMGDAAQQLEAVQFIFEKAGDRPCVVNLSLATNGGPHDGTTLLEQGLDSLVRGKPNRAVVIAAANWRETGMHARVEVPANGSMDLSWDAPTSRAGHEMEIWLPGSADAAVELFLPDGGSLGTVELGSSMALEKNGKVVFAANRFQDPNNGENLINVFLSAKVEAGIWKVRLHSRNGQRLLGDAWIERAAVQSRFVTPDVDRTLGSLSCGHESIVVGAFDAHTPGNPVAPFSSSGMTRDGRQKPEVSAPGVNVDAANAQSTSGTIPNSGTSMAAPAVTGLVALILAEARSRGQDMNITEIRDALISTARRNPPAGANWDPQLGFGRAYAGAIRN